MILEIFPKYGNTILSSNFGTVVTAVMYGLSKIHKLLIDGTPKLRLVLSAINTGTSKWGKIFVPLLKPFTSNS